VPPCRQRTAEDRSRLFALSSGQKIGSDEVLSKVPNFVGYNHFQIFEFAVGITVKKNLYTATDIVLANIALAKRVRSD
jgi:hypothetical protein